MIPTPKLRFVEKQIKLPAFYVDPNTMKPAYQIVHVLQQWWEHTEWNADGEWRDVPIEKENK